MGADVLRLNEKIIGSLVYDDEKLNIIMQQIGKRIMNERISRKLSIADLAELTGIDYSHIYKIEKLKTNVGLSTLLKIAYVFEVPVTYFIPYEDNKREKTDVERFEEKIKGMDRKSKEILFDLIDSVLKYTNSMDSLAKLQSSDNI